MDSLVNRFEETFTKFTVKFEERNNTVVILEPRNLDDKTKQRIERMVAQWTDGKKTVQFGAAPKPVDIGRAQDPTSTAGVLGISKRDILHDNPLQKEFWDTVRCNGYLSIAAEYGLPLTEEEFKKQVHQTVDKDCGKVPSRWYSLKEAISKKMLTIDIHKKPVPVGELMKGITGFNHLSALIQLSVGAAANQKAIGAPFYALMAAHEYVLSYLDNHISKELSKAFSHLSLEVKNQQIISKNGPVPNAVLIFIDNLLKNYGAKSFRQAQEETARRLMERVPADERKVLKASFIKEAALDIKDYEIQKWKELKAILDDTFNKLTEFVVQSSESELDAMSERLVEIFSTLKKFPNLKTYLKSTMESRLNYSIPIFHIAAEACGEKISRACSDNLSAQNKEKLNAKLKEKIEESYPGLFSIEGQTVWVEGDRVSERLRKLVKAFDAGYEVKARGTAGASVPQ